jgi:hypothetical protein
MCMSNNIIRTCLSIGCLKSSVSRLLKSTGDVPTSHIIENFKQFKEGRLKLGGSSLNEILSQYLSRCVFSEFLKRTLLSESSYMGHPVISPITRMRACFHPSNFF